MELDDVINVSLVNGIPWQPQVQCSTHDQLKAVVVLAQRFGLYDAADRLKREIEAAERTHLDT